MGQNPRRPGFRLRWGDAERTDEAAAAEAAAEQDAPAEQASAHEAAAEQAPAAPDSKPAPPADAGSDDVAPATQAEAADVPFLRDLVGAMRGVAESSRDSSLEGVRKAVDERVAELTASSAEKAEALRRAADLDVNGIGEWERTELERIRREAEKRREARRAELETQLADHQSATDQEVEATRSRLADHERELDAFFAQLSEIGDPAAFVAAAKRMPQPPDLTKPSAAAPAKAAAEPTSAGAEQKSATNGSSASTGPTDESLAQRLAQLDQRLSQGEPATEAATPVAGPAADEQAATPEPAPSAAAPAATAGAGAATAVETSTAIVVKGLGSFGAITSFKQALERVDGVRGVTLSLGPTGDFVYRASHAADFDLMGAIRSIEGPNAGIEQSEGSLVVTIAGPR